MENASGKTIGTHSGVFHADDAMGCMLLREFTGKYRGASVVRSRDSEVLNKLDIVIDVGGVYDHNTARYDHHQKGFNETFNEKSDIKLSASGLVYKHYGKEVIENAIHHLVDSGVVPATVKPKVTQEAIEEIYHDLYRTFFVTLDAIDNGIDRYPKEVKPRFEFYKTDLACRVGRLNPGWWDDPKPETFTQNFERAMAICKEEFLDKLKGDVMGSLASRVYVEEAFTKGSHLDERVIVLPRSCFWKESLYKVEEQLGRVGKTLFVIYPDTSGEGFRIQTVSVTASSFEFRKGLKEEWRGLERAALAEKSGIHDIVFCHHSGFIGGARSLENCLLMARLSLEN